MRMALATCSGGGEMKPFVPLQPFHEESSNSAFSVNSHSAMPVDSSSPNALTLEPGFSLVANSVVIVKSDNRLCTPQTYTYKLTIVNDTPEQIELNYQPIMRMSPCQRKTQTTATELKLATQVMHNRPDCDLENHTPKSEQYQGDLCPTLDCGNIIKTEPVDYSITVNEPLDMDSEASNASNQTEGYEEKQNCEPLAVINASGDGIYKLNIPSPSLNQQDGEDWTCVSKSPEIPSLVEEDSSKDAVRDQLNPLSSDVGSFTQVDTVHQDRHSVDRQCSPSPSENVSDKSGEVSSEIGNISPGTMGTCTNIYAEENQVDEELETHISGVSSCEETFVRVSELHGCSSPDAEQIHLKCKHCDKYFTTSVALLMHDCHCTKQNVEDNTTRNVAEHSSKKLHVCRTCGKVFKKPSDMQRHLVVHTNERPFKCTYCDKAFKTNRVLEGHCSRIHGKEKSESGQDDTRRERVDMKLNLCDHCGKAFRRPSELQSHLLTHSDERPFSCEYCNKPFKTSKDLKVHCRIHTNEKPYVCDVCGKAFISSTSLACHKRVHSEERRYSCEYCACTFRQLVGLNQHINSKHTFEKSYTCKLCEKSFLRLSGLTQHVRTHEPKTDEKPYHCEHCVKSFRTKELLTRHIRSHTGEKPYKCRYCDLSFKTCSVRANHQRIHTGDKPYKCSHCGKSFRQREVYIQHLNVHTGKRPYKCKFCEEAFASKATVYNHEKMHKKELNVLNALNKKN